MDEIKITAGKKEYQLEKNSTLLALIEKNMPNAKYSIVGAKKGDEIIELTMPVMEDLNIEWISAASHHQNHIKNLLLNALL